jgi:hypothetical protein
VQTTERYIRCRQRLKTNSVSSPGVLYLASGRVGDYSQVIRRS